ncbi:MAG: HNH endonuclease [Elusimicrobiota bacterium]
MELRPLSDDLLMARLSGLVGQERENLGDVVDHLAEVDRRDLALDRGFPSLFHYCVKELRYSEAAAFLRIRAARASRQFPRISTDLRSGELHLDAVARLYPHLTNENSETLLGQAAGATKREVLAIVAHFEPPGPERDVVRPLSPPSPPPNPADDTPDVLPPPARVRFAFTADDELIVMMDKLRGLLRHKHPQGRLEDLFKTAAKTLLEKIESEKTRARIRKPSASGSRRVPMAVRAEVWSRDGGRCSFVSEEGRRCDSRDALEFDHIRPWALGGRSDIVENIRLLCRSHNLRLARRRFGSRKTVV